MSARPGSPRPGSPRLGPTAPVARALGILGRAPFFDRPGSPALLILLAIGAFLLGWRMSPSAYMPPSGWKTVSFRGMSLSLPGTWPITYHGIVNQCHAVAPKVNVEPSGYFTGSCALQVPIRPFAAIVVVEREGHTPIRHPRSATINGVNVDYEITYEVQRFGQRLAAELTITDITARLPQYEVGARIEVGNSTLSPGGAPGRAMKILDSIRPSNGRTAPLPDQPRRVHALTVVFLVIVALQLLQR